MIDEEDAEIIREFITESGELLDDLDSHFVALEADPRNVERLGAIFRAAHTIKGTAGLLGYPSLEQLSHAAETVLARLRDGHFALTPAIAALLLESVDATRALLAQIESTGGEGDERYTDLGERLVAALPGEQPAAAAPWSGKPAAAPLVVSVSAAALPAPRPPPADRRKEGTETSEEDKAPGSAWQETAIHREVSVRLGVGLLDRLMNLVGELVLARNQVLQRAAESPDASLVAASQRLNLITSELQEGIMKTRMQPIGAVWTKFPRVVRDLAIACGKRVQLELSGEETELDRSVLEAIRDPLVHIVRNSVDHGLETADERRKAGKSETGLIRFRAFHEGGMVNIEVSDDGRGIDPAVIIEKAIERGLIDRARGERLREWEALHLIFLPGFSTAEALTRVSGRGVGMDVVKTSVERIGGTVDIQSTLGKGTRIHFKIPLTLAIVPALIVTCRDSRYAIPQVNLVELVRLEGPDAVEYVRDAPVHRLRGVLLPLIFLRSVLGDPAKARDAGGLTMIVLRADNRTFGLVVDDVADTQEIVVKPLGRELSRLSVFAGATIMGDGKVALILDVFGIAERVGIEASVREADEPPEDRSPAASTSDAMLLFRSGGQKRMAIALDQVDRLEEFAASALERVGSTSVIQYRSQILRLLHVGEILGEPYPEPSGVIQVLVHSRAGQTVGLVVEQIADIVREPAEIDRHVSRVGVLGATVLAGSVIEVLDVSAAWRVLERRSLEPKRELAS